MILLIQQVLDNKDTIQDNLPEVKQIIGKHPLMQPHMVALTHAIAPFLVKYVKHGCPVNCGENWTHQVQIVAVLICRQHVSAITLKDNNAYMTKHAQSVKEGMNVSSNTK